MPLSVEILVETMRALPAHARALLADRLVESLDPIDDEAIRAAWAVEAIRRRDEVRTGAAETVPGDVAAARIRTLFDR